jgi:hypothetical protein
MAIIGVALAQNAETARKVIIKFQCLASANVGELVYIDPSNADKVLVQTGNTLANHTIGAIDSKPQATFAEVIVLGVRGGYSGLTIGAKVWLSPSGSVTTTMPTNGYKHPLGMAVSSTEVLFIPTSVKVLSA